MNQLKALTVKNYLIAKRSPIMLCLEVLIPLLSISFIFIIRDLARIQTYPQQSYISNRSITQSYYGNPNIAQNLSIPLRTQLKKCNEGSVIALAPEGEELVERLGNIFEESELPVKIFQNDQEIDKMIREKDYGINGGKSICFGVSFEIDGGDYRYNLRFNISNNSGPPTNGKITIDQSTNLWYYYTQINSNFPFIATIVSNLILQKLTKNPQIMLHNTLSIIHQQSYNHNFIYQYLEHTFQFFSLFPLLIIYLKQISTMIHEKESGVKEAMHMAGMVRVWDYLAWAFRYIISYAIAGIGSACVLQRALGIDFWGVVLLYVLFGGVLIIQNFVIQLFMQKSKLGIIISLFVFILQYSFSYLISANPHVTTQINTQLSRIPHVAFILAFKTFIYGSAMQIDVRWGDVVNLFKLQSAVYSFICNFVGGLAVVLLIEKMMNLKLNGKLKRGSNLLEFTKQRPNNQLVEETKIQNEETLHQLHSTNNNTLILKNISKSFTSSSKAVSSLSLTLESNQISVILGHNGAGKSTTIGIITGTILADCGEIQVLGKKNMSQIQKMIGVCKQQNSFFDALTVQENLKLFGTLRGLEKDLLKQQINQLLTCVNLVSHKDTLSKLLSGGQKRKLSLSLAFSGNSKVIILDEPTTGLDITSKRQIWSILNKMKQNKIIILTTHLMDEAEFLGDRVCILNKGQIAALGSIDCLKKKFGVGYNIDIEIHYNELNCETSLKESLERKKKAIFQFVTNYLESYHIVSQIGFQIGLQVPFEQFPNILNLFEGMEQNKKFLCIDNYYLSTTTLEQVYQKVDRNLKQCVRGQSERMQKDERDEKEENIFMRHVKATIRKRSRVIKRNTKHLLFQLLIPIIVIAFALYLMKFSFIKDLPSLQLTYRPFLSQQTPVDIPLGVDLPNSGILSAIKSQIRMKYGNSLNVISKFSPTAYSFDKKYLLPLKQENPKLRGGIYLSPPRTLSQYTIIPFTSIMNTKTPISSITTQNILVQAYINSLISEQITLTPVNKPLPITEKQKRMNNTISGFFGAIIFSISLAFKWMSVASFIVKQKTDRCKYQQIVAGLSIPAFWIGNFLFDFLLYFVVSFISLFLCKTMDVAALTEDDAFTATIMLFLLFGLANFPLVYICSFIFSDHGNAQAMVYFFNSITGALFPVIVFLLRWISQKSNPFARTICWFLRIIPSFSFGEGLLNISSKDILEEMQKQNGQKYHNFDYEIALGPILYLLVMIFVFWIGLIVIEWRGSVKKKIQIKKGVNINQIEDRDVLDEVRKINEADPTDYQIFAKSLYKQYKTRKQRPAVDNVSIAIQKGEVFGLLGTNGAGKTTMFKMLTGQITPTFGQCYLQGVSIIKSPKKAMKSVGYCQQFDALLNDLTVKQQLELYYELKSLPSSQKQQRIWKQAQLFHLQNYLNSKCQTLSGGNKRKLQLAIALTGDPQILLLDQPTTGMDPQSRKQIWKTISNLTLEQKRTVVLTTHLIEEAQILANRIGIMVEGQFRCFGNLEKIKQKHGGGYIMEVRLSEKVGKNIEKLKAISDIKSQLSKIVTDIVQLEQQESYIRFGTNMSKNVSKMFQKLEQMKQRNNIKEYLIRQTSMEHIFNQFLNQSLTYKNQD